MENNSISSKTPPKYIDISSCIKCNAYSHNTMRYVKHGFVYDTYINDEFIIKECLTCIYKWAEQTKDAV